MSPPIHTACIIDDDKTCIYVMQYLIKKHQLSERILTYENGQLAIEDLTRMLHLGENLPEIILLDINMPVMDGWEFLDTFKRIRGSVSSPVKIYMVTSSIDDRDIQRCKSYPEILQYVVKPVGIDHLIELFRS